MHTLLRHAASLASLLSLAATATSTLASTSETWDGSVNGWAQAAHWSPAIVPNNGTPAGSTYAVSLSAGQVNLDINATIDSLSLTGGTLNDDLGNSLTVLNATTITNATLQFGTGTATGAPGSFGSVDNFGSFTTGNFTGGNNTVSTTATFTNELNASTFIVGVGDVANFHALTNLGRLLIGAGATVNISGGGNGFIDVPLNSQLQVAGDFKVINGATPSFALGHLATVEGDLQLANHVSTDAAAIAISAAGNLELNGNQTFSGTSITNSGAVNLGYFSGANNTLTLSGAFTNNANAYLRLANTGDIVNVASITNAGTIQINATETLNITGGGSGIVDVVQGSTYSIGGAFNVINGNVTSSAFAHTATIEGDLRLGTPSTIADAAAMTISSAGNLELIGNQTFSTPSINNSGSVNLGYFAPGNNTLTVTGTLTNNPNAALRIVAAGDTVNVGALVNQGSITTSPGEIVNITGGGSGVTDVVQSATFSISGTFNVINGNVTSSAFGHLTSIEGDLRLGTGTAIADASSISISTTGNLELTGNQTFSTPAITNSGSVNLGYFAGGNNTLTVTGTLTNNPNAALRIADTGDTVNVGSLVNQGYVATNPGEILNITGGGNGITDVVAGATFSLGGPFNVINGNVTSSALGHLASIEGDLRLSIGSSIADANAITLSPSGALELTGNQTFSAPSITNSGSVNLGYFATGNNTLTISGTFTNNVNAALRLAGTGDVVNVGALVNQGFIGTSSGEILNITGGGAGITTILAGSTLQLGGSINVINGGIPSNGLANLATVAGSLQLFNGQTLNVGNISLTSTGQLFLGNASTLHAGNITNSGFLASSYFTTTGNTFTVTGTLTNNTGATFNIQSGDTTSLANLNNSGTVNINFNYTLPLLNGGTGNIFLSANGTVLTLNGGSSQNTIHDSNQFGVSGSLISNNNVQTGPLQLASVTINGHHKIAAPGSKINTLTLQGSSNNWTSGLDLVPFAQTILEDSVTHNTTLARTLDQVNFGRTHANGIYSSALAANERLVVIDNAAEPTPFSSFGGQSADAGSILLMPTYLGDATLDGKVDLNDLNVVLNHLGVTTSHWTAGNFDGAATIDLNDLNDVLNNLGLSSPFATAALIPATASPAPEPGSLATIGAALGLLAIRVRRKR